MLVQNATQSHCTYKQLNVYNPNVMNVVFVLTKDMFGENNALPYTRDVKTFSKIIICFVVESTTKET